MGAGTLKRNSLKQSEIIIFRNMTSIPNEVLLKLNQHFTKFSNLKRDDGLIDYEEFCMIMNKEDNILSRKLFGCMDLNKDRKINFREFLTFFSKFLCGSKEEQTRITFKIFVDEEKNLITYENVLKMTKEIFLDMNVFDDLFDEFSLTNLIKETFGKAQNLEISYDEFQSIVEEHPGILFWFKINVNIL